MKILILSISPWSNTNSVGNSLSHFFQNFPNAEFANIYLKPGKPDNNVCNRYFQINEKQLLQGKCGKSINMGTCENSTRDIVELKKTEQSFFDFLRKKRYLIFFIIRELIWKVFLRKSEALETFLKKFQPDILFCLVNETVYSNRFALCVKEMTGVPMVGCVWDDVYAHKSKKLFTVWYRSYIRKSIRNVVSQCDILYTISDIQKKEYQECFGVSTALLQKGKVFVEKPCYEVQSSKGVLRMVFTGNIGAGRYKTLAMIGRALKKINNDGIKAYLDIYTLTPKSKKILQLLDIAGSVSLNDGISAEEVGHVQKKADILVHVESFDKKEIQSVRQSFSTKIVDYLYSAKCIFAVGPKEVASMDYLIKNDAAITVTNEKEMEEKIRMLIDNPEVIREYGHKAWLCGKRNHQIQKIQERLYRDFEEIIHESSTN